jgi:hypothetical protein
LVELCPNILYYNIIERLFKVSIFLKQTTNIPSKAAKHDRRKEERKEGGRREESPSSGVPTRKEGEFIVGDMEEYKT